MKRVSTPSDVIALAVPKSIDVEHDPRARLLLEQLARDTVWAQWDGSTVKPIAIEFEKIVWLITDKPEAVEAFQPAHDCARCRAGNDQAEAFLRANPGRHVALGNIRYVQVWER